MLFDQFKKFGSRAVIGAALCLGFTHPLFGQEAAYQQIFSSYQNQRFDEAESGWMELAGEGDMRAQYALGVMHLREEAKDPSPQNAVSWFEKAADQGHPPALYNLGVAYWEGNGVAEDKSRALSLWQKAADNGDSGAQFNLGLAYYTGAVVDTDLKLAHSWLRLASEQNHEEARHMLDVIEADLQAPTPSIAAAPDTPTSTSNTANNTTEPAPPAKTVSAEPSTDGEEKTPVAVNSYWKTVDDTSRVFNKPGGTGFRQLPPGTPIDVTEQKDDWARITLPDGLRTWIYASYIKIDGDSGVVSGEKVRIRPEPSTDNAKSPPLGYYVRGDQLQVLNNRNDWVEVRAPKTVTAWIAVSDIVQYEDTADNRAAAWQQARADGV